MNITLRDYNREIESLINSSNYDEAIFHCKTILQKYPKCIETYRHLGNALLENKRFLDASEIYSKVLSVYPDDFVSHVGLSMIKEEERDLDTAIWHMERAYDSQPSNLAIQEEMKRLLGKRDGVIPSRLRLTKGALIRMYIKGELYNQAITEIENAIKTEEEQEDLKVLLSRLYHLTDSNIKAAETASAIISKFPFCFEANRIMYALTYNALDKEKSQTYRARLIELDPYFEFINDTYHISSDVPAENISLERPVFVPEEQGESESPDWAKQIGIEWIKEESVLSEKSLGSNEYINSPSNQNIETTSTPPFMLDFDNEDTGQVESNSQSTMDPLPDWIAKAGWMKSSEASDHSPVEEPIDTENGSNEHVTIEQSSSEQELTNDLLSGQLDTDRKVPVPHLEIEGEDPSEEPVPSSELPDWLSALQQDDEIPSLDIEDYHESDVAPENISHSADLKASIDHWTEKRKENEIIDQAALISSSDQVNLDTDGTQEPKPGEVLLPDWLSGNEDQVTDSPDDHDLEKLFKSFQENTDQLIPVVEPLNDDSSSQSLDFIQNAPPMQDDFIQESLDGNLPVSNENPETLNSLFDHTELEDKPPISQGSSSPSWIKEVLSTSDDIKSPSSENANDSLGTEAEVPSLINELENEDDRIGLISSETNDELLTWLREVDPEEPKGFSPVESPVVLDENPSPEYEGANDFINSITEPLSESSPLALEIENGDLIDRLSDVVEEKNQISATSTESDIATTTELPNEPDMESLLIDNDAIEESNTSSITVILPVNPNDKVLSQEPAEYEDFNSLSDMVEINLPEGHSSNEITSNLSEKLETTENSFDYWIAVGDRLNKNDETSQALDAYANAEKTLLFQ